VDEKGWTTTCTLLSSSRQAQAAQVVQAAGGCNVAAPPPAAITTRKRTPQRVFPSGHLVRSVRRCHPWTQQIPQVGGNDTASRL